MMDELLMRISYVSIGAVGGVMYERGHHVGGVMFEIARKSVKCRPCRKRNGHSFFRHRPCFLLVTVVGQIVKTPRAPKQKISRHISDENKWEMPPGSSLQSPQL